jgi:hypothetical protein
VDKCRLTAGSVSSVDIKRVYCILAQRTS